MHFDFDSLILFRRNTIQFLIETGKQSNQMQRERERESYECSVLILHLMQVAMRFSSVIPPHTSHCPT